MSLEDDLITKNENEINMMSPISIAYVGDSVYSTYIRTYLANTTNFNQNKMNLLSINYVSAKSQAYILSKLVEEEFITDEEKDIVRRGRNAKPHHLPKNSSISDYSHATAFETLVGYLFLTKKEDRLKEILNKCIDIVRSKNE